MTVTQGVPVLQMRGICKQYPGVRALANAFIFDIDQEVRLFVGRCA